MDQLMIRFSRSVLIILVVLASILDVREVAAQKGTGTIRVAQAGGVAHDCGSEVNPCPTIQDAVQRALPGDIILVAGGTYISVFPCLSELTVFCVLNKKVTIIGGYSTSNWATPDPAANPTIFDGQGIYRVGIVQGPLPPDPLAAGLQLENVTIQNGYKRGASSGSDEATFVFGGGIEDNYGLLVFRHVVFKNNKALGGDTNLEHGGAGSGGGLALRFAPVGTYLENVTFDGNVAQGGRGATRGGFGIGGGLYTYNSIMSADYLTATHNLSSGGDAAPGGAGSDTIGEEADGQGGGIALQISSDTTLQHLTIISNTTMGGGAPNGNAGGAFGGGIFAQSALVVIRAANIRDNVARGGNGNNSGSGASIAAGGGLQTDDSNVILDRVSLINNQALGGNGNIKGGPAGGGGGYLARYHGNTTVLIQNCIFANNYAAMGSGTIQGGGGGGLWLQGTQATIIHTTFAQNRLSSSPMQGSAILVLNDGAASASVADISYSVIADHTSYPGAPVVYVKSGNSATLNHTLWAPNTQTFSVASGATGSNSNPITAASAMFVSPGTPNYDYHILKSSPARNAANGSSMDVDIDGKSRALFAPADIGADEYVPIVLSVTPIANTALRLQWKTNAALVTGINHYEISISCESGANCPGTINAGLQTSYVLSNLTNFKHYTFTVSAKNSGNAVIDTSNSVGATPTDRFVYLPVVLK